MLLAVIEAKGSGFLERIGRTLPVQPVLLSRRGSCFLAGWPSAAGTHVDVEAGWATEGGGPSVDFAALDLEHSVVAHLPAQGVLVAMRPDSLFISPGRAGGYRPIYVARTPQGVVICTSLMPILAALPVRPELDLDFLAAELTLEPPRFPGATPYRTIETVPHGEVWVVRVQHVRRQSGVPPLREPEMAGTPTDLAHRLREELSASVARSAATGGRVAVAASGGLDSSAVLAVAHGLWRSAKLRYPPLACTVHCDDPADGPHLQSLTDALRVDIKRVDPRAMAPDLARHFVTDSAPTGSSGLMSDIYASLAAVARENGAEALLTGDGGDAVVDGTPSLLADVARGGRPLQALAAALRLRGPMLGGPVGRVRDCILRPIVGSILPERLRSLKRRGSLRADYPWAGPRLRVHLRALADAPSVPRPSLEWSPSERYRALLSRSFFRDVALARAREESITRIQRFEPFLDDAFLRFVATVPPLSLLHGDACRGLLREALRGLVPEALRMRRSKGFLGPALVGMLDAAGGFRSVAHLADATRLADLGLIEPRAFRAHFDTLARRSLGYGWRPAWAVLSVEAFVRAYDRSDGHREAA